MVESPDFRDPLHGIPVFSPVRRGTTPHRRDDADLRCTARRSPGSGVPHLHLHHHAALCAMCSKRPPSTVRRCGVLDRPNPAGRPVEGLTLRSGWESFVGAGPMPMRHGLTMGELAQWFIATLKLDVEWRVITMQGWLPEQGPRLRLATGRAHLDQPQPERCQPLDGPSLRWHGDARRHHAFRRARHHAPAGAFRRPGY